MSVSSPAHAITAAAPEAGTVEPHSLGRSALLHLAPGGLILALFVATAPRALRMGLPPLVPVLASAVIGLAFQLWHLLHEGHRQSGRWTLAGVVLYRRTLPAGRSVAIVAGCVVLAFAASALTAPIGGALLARMPWLPSWFELRDPAQLLQYPRSTIVLTYVLLYFPINGIAAPIIEELYFRGYLMPRLSRYGRWTPVVAVTLFTLYHFWQPYYWPAQFLGILPLAYAVWRTQSVRLGIAIHASLNIIGGLLNLGLIFAGAGQ